MPVPVARHAKCESRAPLWSGAVTHTCGAVNICGLICMEQDGPGLDDLRILVQASSDPKSLDIGTNGIAGTRWRGCQPNGSLFPRRSNTGG